MRDIGEPDWKIYRQLHPIAVERFCDKVLSEVSRLASNASLTSHNRYLAIHKLIEERDQELDQVFDYLRRSTALRQLAMIRFHGLLPDEEFARFSAEARGAVDVWLVAWRA
jgi:hypothetical protein